MRLANVTPVIALRLLDTVYSAIKIAGPSKFKVGDSVRVSKYKIFKKGYTPNWTTEVFTIVKIQRTNPVIYLLEDYHGKSVAGTFYEHELHRATHPDVYLVEKVLRRKGDKVYIKWLGFDGSLNSWIYKTMSFDKILIFFISTYKKYININIYKNIYKRFFFIILSIFVQEYTDINVRYMK